MSIRTTKWFDPQELYDNKLSIKIRLSFKIKLTTLLTNYTVLAQSHV